MTDVTAGRGSDHDVSLPFRYWTMPTGATLAFLAILALTVFSLFPGLDITVSHLFFVEGPCRRDDIGALACGDFPASSYDGLKVVRQTLQAIPFLVALGVGVWLLAKLLINGRLGCALSRTASTAFWVYVLSVGLVVNAGLKEFSGRPRPIDTDLFGGALPFVPAGDITGYCASNCSFVSGETASAFWLLCVVPLLPLAWRLAGFALAAGFAVLTGGLRIAFGAHYLSDVVLAAIITLLISWLLTTIAARIHQSRPHLGMEVYAEVLEQVQAWLKQAREWPRRRESWA